MKKKTKQSKPDPFWKTMEIQSLIANQKPVGKSYNHDDDDNNHTVVRFQFSQAASQAKSLLACL